MPLVIATGGIDLSVGSLMVIAGALAQMIFTGHLLPVGTGGFAILFAFILPITLVTLLGAFAGLLVTYFRIQPIVATQVLFNAGRGIAQAMTNGNLQPPTPTAALASHPLLRATAIIPPDPPATVATEPFAQRRAHSQ